MIDFLKFLPELQKIQAKNEERIKELSSKIFIGEAGAGSIKVTMNGLGKVLAVKIDPSLLDAKDTTLIEDLIVGAMQQASAKLEAIMKEEAAKNIHLFEDIIKSKNT